MVRFVRIRREACEPVAFEVYRSSSTLFVYAPHQAHSENRRLHAPIVVEIQEDTSVHKPTRKRYVAAVITDKTRSVGSVIHNYISNSLQRRAKMLRRVSAPPFLHALCRSYVCLEQIARGRISLNALRAKRLKKGAEGRSEESIKLKRKAKRNVTCSLGRIADTPKITFL